MRALIARMDNAGDVLLAGPAVRAVAAQVDSVTLLAGPRGSAAAHLLPGVDSVIEWCAPWIDPEPPPIRPDSLDELRARVAAEQVDVALILTSFHQSPLPLALLLREAGVGWIGAISEDYPGSLLDLRHRVEDSGGDIPEAERALSLADAAGFVLPSGDSGRLAVRRPLPDVAPLLRQWADGGYVAVHPAASAPAREWSVRQYAATVRRLRDLGHRVVVTGTPADIVMTAEITADSGDKVLDLAGRTNLAELAAVLDGASVLVAPNTGPAHLAAAVGTPVVSLFAPVVAAERWAPYGVSTVLLGDQSAPCRGTRARHCPVAGHPCLNNVTPGQVVRAVRHLRGQRATQPAVDTPRSATVTTGIGGAM